jgi:uncharacterized membrane protein YeaQ/YmgE (transglycosylase-associated protein family)
VTLAFILFILVWGFIIGGLARLALPGPDPMPWWATIALGIAGSIVGGLISRIFFGAPTSVFLAFVGALILLAVYRHFIQHRPLWGPGARRPPSV